jgi:hypothetical protein
VVALRYLFSFHFDCSNWGEHTAGTFCKCSLVLHFHQKLDSGVNSIGQITINISENDSSSSIICDKDYYNNSSNANLQQCYKRNK